MKKLSLSIFVLCVLAFGSCSKLKNENPAAISSVVGFHPDGMSDPASQNFHGILIAAQNGDTKECTKCHGMDYNGGTAKKSCNACHRHPAGVLDPASSNFHGKVVAANNYSMNQCKKCHASDYTGGISGVSCLTCHNKVNGPENCTTCHGSTNPAPPVDLAGNSNSGSRGVGMHQQHLAGGLLGPGMGCSTCHVVPATLTTPGHINATPQAVITFNPSSIAFMRTNVDTTLYWSSTLPTVVPNPSYSLATIKCSSTYCHGNFKNGNPTNAPAWNDTTAAAVACGTCHGDVTKATLADRALPKSSLNGGTHPTNKSCSVCHADVVDVNLKIINPSKHMNGKLNVFTLERNF
jgi:predicted CxxxxCH...CXXCH cytochrome family protein